MNGPGSGIVCFGDGETVTALRLAGVEGREVQPPDLEDALMDVYAGDRYSVVLVTRLLAAEKKRLIRDLNLSGKGPVILEIPGVVDAGGWDESVMRYVAGALGIGL